MKILFVDDRLEEVIPLWESSGCASDHELLPLEPFRSVERTCEMVIKHQPHIVLVGFGLSVPCVTGADVVRALREQGFGGQIIGNSGGGPRQFERSGITLTHHVNRKPQQLKETLYAHTF